MSITDVNDYTDSLKERLEEDHRIIDISLEFANFTKNDARVKFLEKLLKEYDLLGDSGNLRHSKSNAIAEQCRLQGNIFYNQRKFLDALECYNQCLSFAQPGGELNGLAYANRSAAFIELKLFQHCLENIEKARINNYPEANLQKLNRREQSCLEMINNGVKETSNDLIGAEYLELSYDPNPEIPFIAKCLKLESSDTFGRFITTTMTLRPGDVIAIEEPFSTFLLPGDRYKYCANCLKDNFMNLQPCPTCTVTMFCSKECEETGMAKFHRFECPIIDKMNLIGTKVLRIAIRTFFEALDACGGSVQNLKSVIEENSSEITVFDFNHPTSRVNLLKTIDALASNENQRNQSEIFQRSGVVGIFCNLLLNHTELGIFLGTEKNRDFFRRFIFKQNQIAACNYHGIFNGVMRKSEVESSSQYASGSFPFCSLINHSCAPNVVRLTCEGKNYVVVNRLIDEGQQIFDNYGFHHCLESKQKRQVQLLQQYKFKCACEACLRDYPLYTSLTSFDSHFDNYIGDDVAKLANLNYKRAKEKMSHYCQYLEDRANRYPCYEVSSIQECLLRCFNLFGLSEFKLKLLDK